MKTLTIISQGRTTCMELQEQLKTLLGNRVQITGYYIDGHMAENIHADVVVISGKHSYEQALPHIAPGCPVILARRAINYHEVGALFDLPEGLDVLLVNDLMSSALDTIELLKALGLDHINYHPYAPGMTDYPPLKTAITPGEKNLVPPCAETVINIRTRVIDITTLTEILDKLSFLDETANHLSASYLRDIIGLIKASKHSTSVSNKMRHQLQTIINTVHDGIIAVDTDHRIRVFNPVAETLFQLPADSVIGSPLDALPDWENAGLSLADTAEKESFWQINRRPVIINAAKIKEHGTELGTVYTFKDVSEIQRLEEALRRELVSRLHVAPYTLDQIQGQSPGIVRTLELSRKMSAADAPILILGDSGTGKELFAQGIHNASARRRGPFIAVNFAAMTESLLESELFGYEEGAFTGARKGGAQGLFEQAHKGTIFLDEIGDSPMSFQVKLLRVLQEKQLRRVGGSRIIPIDVRIIAATNRDLTEMIKKGSFRQDLYYRLNVLTLSLPPLKDRSDDILLLAASFYRSFVQKRSRALPAEEYFRLLGRQFLSYNWPGNIRELQNIVEYLVTVCPDQPPTPQLLAEKMPAALPFAAPPGSTVQKLIMDAVCRAAAAGQSVGRRSLSASLHLPESTVRKALLALEAEGAIVIHKGRRGICAAAGPS